MEYNPGNMTNKRYPFLFLKSYQRKDYDLFFGRNEEIETLYQYTQQSSMVLVYGPSGTGKTSLIRCGLASKFKSYDWQEIYVRRGKNILESFDKILCEESNDDFSFEEQDGQKRVESLKEKLQAVYKASFKPLYFVFDQFEELFVLGDKEEQDAFADLLKELQQITLPMKIIFSIREEYLGQLYDMERKIPVITRKKLRVEPMGLERVKKVILGACEHGINPGERKNNTSLEQGNEEKVAEGIFEKIRGKERKTLTIPLPYLQVFLDKLYLHCTDGDEERKSEAVFTLEKLESMGEIGDVLRDFLEGAVHGAALELDKPDDDVWKLLSPFASLEGTKVPRSVSELSQELPDKFDEDLLNRALPALETFRVLSFSGSDGRYEMTHDSLARHLAERRGEDEIAKIEIQRLVKSSVSFTNAREYFTPKQLDFIEPHLSELKLSPSERDWIEKSRNHWKEEAERQEADRERRLREAEEQARKEAELRQSAESALEQAEHSRRRATKFARGAVVLAVLALAASFYAYMLQEKAEAARVEAVSQGVRADSSARIANIEKVRADSSAQLALAQKAIAEQKTVEAENNLQRAKKEELRAKAALDQVRKEKSATEAQRLRAEDNYRIAQAKTAEAESAKEEAERNLENVRKSNEAVVRAFLKNARENWQDGRYREAYSKIVLADTLDLLSSEVMNAYLDNKSACLANTPDYGLALESVSRAYATGALSRERMTDVYVGMADTSMLNLHYDTTQIIVGESLKQGAHSAKVGKLYLDLSYWYCEVDSLDKSLSLLGRAYELSGRELSVSGVADTVSLHRLMFELSGSRYSMLHARYYPVMVEVPGGSFDMGSPKSDKLSSDDERPVHRVTLSSFMLSATEVTVFQYSLYCSLTNRDIRENIVWPNSGDNPVVNVSWYDAIGYSNWLSERMGLRGQYAIDRNKADVNNNNEYDDLKWTVTPLPGSDGYRLPTESEWEYAARGGEKSKGYRYAGGDSLDLAGWYDGNSGNRTHAVGGKLPNELGLYDMSGNVWEWCWDRYGDYDDKVSTNPQGAGKGGNRVSRGGSWINDPQICRAANRLSNGPTDRTYILGFRLASPLQ